MSTIKAKIIVLITSVLILTCGSISFFTYSNYKNDQDLMIQNADMNISNFAESIKKDITKLENNALDLALMGEIYIKADKNASIANHLVEKVFYNYEHSLGGGIWFEPYTVFKNQLRRCVYAFRAEDGKVVLDPTFESERYDYLTQNWYTEIKSKLNSQTKIAWSMPYYENQGSNSLMITTGAGIYQEGKLIGISTVDWKINHIIEMIRNMRPTKSSFALFANLDTESIIVMTDPFFEKQDTLGRPLSVVPWYKNYHSDTHYFGYHHHKYLSIKKHLTKEMILIINVPTDELFEQILHHFQLTLLFLLLTSLLTVFLIYFTLSVNVNKPIEKLISFAKKVSCGEIDAQVEISKPAEFANLAKTFNKMNQDIQTFVNNLNESRISREIMNSELNIASTIQSSALPNDFFEKNGKFEIFASMKTAKSIGGDFYDFFFIDEDHFAFLIADVSGKGIPASLFMMTTKTLIKNTIKFGQGPIEELIETANNQICENNAEEMFVTMFVAIVDLKNHKMKIVNAGHNPPLIKIKDGKFKYMTFAKKYLFLGGLANVKYQSQEIYFTPGDRMFLYTDGVTEAQNKNDVLFGEQALLECLNNNPDADVKEQINLVAQKVAEHANGAEQSDDITMLSFKLL